MDIALTPKLLAAALVGATIATHLPKAAAQDTVLLRFEWAGTKAKESLTLRAPIDEPTTVRQGARTVEVKPEFSGDGNYIVRLQLKDDSTRDEPESLTTSVRAQNGETLMIMGRTRKEGKAAQEKLLFLTVNSI